ncbi:MAG: alpha-1,2-fucosyltransferase, partial [Candidatus Roizmanbacteria bacterium]|nr:alpha-1,2-fucosyltransferase [Candidatus Roizmanbacteria bacterium]
MIIINLTGGLGNQMFQYAFGRYLSLKHKTELKYHFTNALFNTQRAFALDVFNIKASKATNKDLRMFGIASNRYINRIFYLLDERYGIQFNQNIVTQRSPHIFADALRNIPDNSYVQGFFNDERFFKGIEETIRKDFTPKIPLDKKNKKIIDEMKQVNSVSIHVRRGDYITNKANAKSMGFLGLNYYRNAINKISNTVQNPYFYIFSDDIDWCKTNLTSLTKNITFINHNSGKNSYKDLLLMATCKQSIIANSTFSWWGGWLNQNKNRL